MSNLSWYIARFQQMGPAEAFWRARTFARLPIEYVEKERARSKDRYQPVGAWWKQEQYPLKPHRHGGTLNQIRIFDLSFPVDTVFDWHRDYRHGRTAARQFSGTLDTRDPAVVGDIKYIWELNRHQHLSALAYSNRADAEELVWAALRSWIEDNPFLVGVNWTSSLELSLRLISWALLYPIVQPRFETDREFRESFAASIYLHLASIRKHLSLYSSANNHLIGELTGLYAASLCFPWWPECKVWRGLAVDLLEREVQLQFSSDGLNREQATSYQLFTLELLMFAILVARNVGDTFSSQFQGRIAAALNYLDQIATPGGDLPWFGDSDDARGFLLSQDDQSFEVVMQLGALFFREPRFSRRSSRITAAAQALLPSACQQLHGLAAINTGKPPALVPFRDGGVLVLQSDECKIVMDVGPLGYGGLAAHGHADALSLLVALGDEYLIVDSGTFAYHSHPEWRSYFRGTAAHNTVRVDGVNQSVIAGRFLWSSKAKVRVIDSTEENHVVRIAAEHDGYCRLTDPVIHRRIVTFHKDSRIVNIEDVLTCKGPHQIEVLWHLSEHLEVIKQLNNHVKAIRDGRLISFTFSAEGFSLDVIQGAVAPIAGWRSTAFNHKTPIPTLRFAGQIVGTTSITTSVHLV